MTYELILFEIPDDASDGMKVFGSMGYLQKVKAMNVPYMVQFKLTTFASRYVAKAWVEFDTEEEMIQFKLAHL